MPDQNQFTNPDIGRPAVRPTVIAPIQRGNYGIPPRSQPIGIKRAPQSTVSPAAPAALQAVESLSPPPMAKAVAVNPVIQPAPAPVASTEPRPFFAAPQPITAPQPIKQPRRITKILPQLILVLLTVGCLLMAGGAVRWLVGGRLGGDSVAVGAVTANTGSVVTIQFVATDGLLHKFQLQTNSDTLTPGTALQVAYRPDKPTTSARQLSIITNNRNLGFVLLLTGLGLTVIGGVGHIVHKRSATHTAQPAAL